MTDARRRLSATPSRSWLGLFALVLGVLSFSGSNGARAATGSLPTFSDPPRDVEFLRTGLFVQPLVPIGATTSDENRAFSRAIVSYEEARRRSAEPEAIASLTDFLRLHPSSAWRPSLLLDLAAVYRQTGHFSKALTTWQAAWDATKDLSDPNGRALGDATVAALSQFEAYLGRKELLAPLLEQAKRRSLHGTAAELVSESARGLADMNDTPETAYRCGPMALKRILQSTEPSASIRSASNALERAASTPKGLSLTAVQKISETAGMSYQMAFRKIGAPVILPAVVHWNVGHYAAIVKQDELGRYRVEDPTFGENVRMDLAALDEEASGYFLVPKGSLPAGWRAVDASEGERVWGRGDTGTNKDNGATGNQGCPGGCTSWNVEMMVVGLALHDRPLSYKPPVGPEIKLDVQYSHRDVQQPAIFTYVNLGSKWTTSWLSYVTDSISTNGTIDLYRRGGGDEPFTFDSGLFTSHPGQFSQSVITRRVDSSLNTSGFSRLLNDGSIEDFSLAVGNQFFMTSFSDPQGNKVTLTYDAQLRITKVTDAIGQVTTLSYELASDPLKITKVTDPFGRAATFAYNPAGQLGSITDVLGITSSYVYGANDFVQKLTTPYGSSTFTYGDAATDPTLGSTRFVEATDALGATTRVEFAQGINAIANADPSAPIGIGVDNYYLNYRNTFVWDPVQYQAAKSAAGLDHLKATILHWLHTADDSATSRTLESTKSPLESRVWYTYPNQPLGFTAGTTNNIIGAGRLLDDGSSAVETYTYNLQGKVTQANDTLGRQWTLGYAPNGIDLTSVANTTKGATDQVLTATYNAQHEPLTWTGANGKTTTFEYNAAGQVTKRTDAQGNATTYAYDGKGYLTSIQGPVAQATTTIAYDNQGRIATTTDSVGGTITYAYDAADRVTGATFPDGTSTKLTYNLLEPKTMTDRLGQTTTLTFDAERQLVSVTDPLGQLTKYGYSPAKKLTSLTDPNGHVTTWTLDGQERVISKTYADGTTQTLAYEATTSRIHSLTDAAKQVTTYGYALDGATTSLLRSQGLNTEALRFAYDAKYPRLTSMTDPLGVTTYAYGAVGALGANQLATTTSPVAGAPAGTTDTVSLAYDELDRVTARTVDGTKDTTAFDALGRVTNMTNALDNFTYAYADATPRVSGITSPHGPELAFTYKDPKGDELLGEIDATGVGKTDLAKLTYGYNADDNVTSFAQSYLGKALTASGASGAVIGPLASDLTKEPETSSKVNAPPTTLKMTLGIFVAWCAPLLLALFALLRTRARHRAGWLIPVVLGIFLGGCSGCGQDTGSGPAASTTYVYDAANRVTAAQGQGAAAYAYDSASNLTSITTQSGDAKGPQVNTFTSTNGIASATYDANGNPTSLSGATYTWDLANRLATAMVGNTKSVFTYDGMSRLVRIVDTTAGAVTEDRAFTWCGTERCAAHDNTQSGSPIAVRYFAQGVVDGGQAYYEVRDLLGSVRQVVDATGKVRAQYDYDPYGNRTKLAGDRDSEIGYAGYYHHAASGLDFTLYRAYDATHGRWLNRDPIGERGGNNLYGYARGNPVNLVDPSGRDPLILLGAAIAAAGDLAWQLSGNGGSLGCVNWGEVAGAAVVGGLVGAIGPAALGEGFWGGLAADEAGALRAFWSGSEAARDAAAAWAAANGAETLEMTQIGQSLTATTAGMDWAEAGPLWDAASADFAGGASGPANVFQDANGVRVLSAWARIEFEALSENPDVTEIIYHIVGK